MANKRKKRHWWKNIKFKYRLTIVNENTLEEVFGLYVSKLNGLSVLFTVLLILFSLTALIMVYTPLRNYLPGYMSNELRATIVDNALQIDSLEQVAEQQRRYIANIQDLMAGRVNMDSVQTMADIDSLTAMEVDELQMPTEREEAFRQQYEAEEQFNLTAPRKKTTDTDGLEFYRPTRGILSSVFDADLRHYGVDIAANPNESVLATLEGTVIWSTYSTETGYVIALQHRKGLVSVYKHCGALLKQQGEFVKAGEVIALVGNTGVHTTGPHLHFELWNKGQALDPEKYIVF
ncbi:MAG: M23 family metallopeptidase [Bacteroidaceae bacterium]|nr:M23 family metallopeptidase [Akkermansia sp.]MBR6590679.1 M23 family metallopeptidase [Bacteroidaceae bacterium]